MRVEARSRLDRSYAEHAPTCAALALFITGDAGSAVAIARRSFERATAGLHDLSSDDALELRVLSATVSAALRLARRSPPRPERRDPLWDALLGLRPRQRAAVALTHFEDIDEWYAADVMACSPSSINSLVSSARRKLQDHSPSSDIDGEIRNLLEERARLLPERFDLGEESATRIVGRRRLVAVGSSVLLVAMLGLGTLGTRTLVERARASGGSGESRTLLMQSNRSWEETFPRLATNCPLRTLMQPIPEHPRANAAEEVAVGLNRALVDKRLDIVRNLLLNPAAFKNPWAHTQTKRGVRVTLSASARGNDLVRGT
ncbi:MAG: hypothetical protein ACRDKZ_14445, partial [Actinomycetota bacterium]